MYIQMFPHLLIFTEGGLCLPSVGAWERFNQRVFEFIFNFFRKRKSKKKKMIVSAG